MAACALWSPVQIDPVVFALLVALALGAEAFRLVNAGHSISASALGVVIAAAVPLVGPLGAAFVGVLPTALLRLRSGLPLVARVFNSVQHGLIGVSGGVIYLVIGGRADLDRDASVGDLLIYVLMPLLVAAITQLCVNAVLLAGVLHLDEGVSFRLAAWTVIRAARLVYCGYGIVSFLFVVLWQIEGLGPLSLLLVVPPLILAQWSIGGQAEEREARQRTLNTLVAAVETRGAQRRGQSERVVEVCTAIGEAVRLGPASAESLRFAAAVHNVGLIVPPAAGAAHHGPTLERIHEHPARGVAMLEGIDFLDESRSAIAHHHERWDGTGYPDGLSGRDIPVLARILAVADLYVALTWGTERATPRQALAVIEQRAGTHLDPSCVTGLRRALDRRRIADVPPPEGAQLAVDHDAPEVADRMGPR